MPVLVNVGVSRKLWNDGQSQGYSLNIQDELPAGIVDDPQAMAEASESLFRLANDLLDAQVQEATTGGPGSDTGKQGQSAGPAKPNRSSDRLILPAPSQGNGNGNRYQKRFGGGTASGQGSGNGNGHRDQRGITEAQAKAISNMTKRLNVQTDQLVRDEFGVNSLNDLSIQQASELIDGLKNRLQGVTTQGGGQ